MADNDLPEDQAIDKTEKTSSGGASGDDYDAFLSYSTAVDRQLAPRLQGAVERFATPWYRPRSLRIFRDNTNLSVSPGLWQAIESSIASARFFILLASPAAAQSKWVKREVQNWLERHGSDRFLIVLTSGTIAWDDVRNDLDWTRTDALPEELAQAFSQEPLYVDLRWARDPKRDLSMNNPLFAQAVLSLSARIQSRPLDELGGEAVRQRRTLRRIVIGVVTTVAILTVAAVAMAYMAIQQSMRADERAEDALTRDSLRLAFASRGETRNGNAIDAIALALSGLPSRFDARRGWWPWEKAGPDRPVVPENVGGLVEALSAQRETREIGHFSSDRGPMEYGWLDGKEQIFTLSKSGHLSVWDATSGARVSDVTSPSSHPKFLSISDEGPEALVADDDGRIILWNWHTGKQIRQLPVNSPAREGWQDRLAVTWSKHGARLLMVRPQNWSLYDLPTGNLIKESPDQSNTGLSTGFYERSDRTILRLMTGSNVELLDAKTGNPLDKVDMFQTKDSLFESRDGNTIMTVGFLNEGGAVIRGREDTSSSYEITNSVELSSREFVNLSENGKFLAKVNVIGQIEITRAQSRAYSKFLFTGEPVQDVRFSADGSRLIALLQSGAIELFEAGPAGWFDGFQLPPPAYAGVVSPDGKFISLSGLSINGRNLVGVVATFDVTSGVKKAQFETGDWVERLATDDSGKRMAVMTTGGKLMSWIEAGNKPDYQIDLPNGAQFVDLGYLAASGEWAVATTEGKVRFIEARSGAETHHLDLSQNEITSFAISPDGRSMAAIIQQRTLVTWEVGRLQETRLERPLGTQSALSVSISSDGRVLVGTENGDVMLWDNVDRPALPIVFHTDGHGVNSVSFDSDSRRVAAATAAGNVFVWDEMSPENDIVIRQASAQIYTVRFAWNGNDLFTTGHDGKGRVWPIGQGIRKLIELGKSKMIRCMNPDRASLYGFDNSGTLSGPVCISQSAIQLPGR